MNTKFKIYKFLFAIIILFQVTACSKKDNPNPQIPEDTGGNTEQVDKLVYTFMSKNKVPGLSLAITQNGKLVFAKGYGFADQETGVKVTTGTRFRISSISKSITSAAIMKLMEEGQLSLNQKVFGTGSVLGYDFGHSPYGAYITDITIRHCLQHHVGGWSNSSSDPTMLHNSMNVNQLLTWIIDNRALDVAPGSAYAYSNVGYMILGRVIEKISGLPYDEYVKKNILKPSGVVKMEIGGSTLAERKQNESKYYGKGSENPYGYNFSRRDANGGWIASSTDLARLFVHIDGMSTVPDILAPATIQTMVTPSFTNQNRANGFAINGSTWYHGGAFPGSRSFWMRTGSGFCGAVFANTSVSNLDDLLKDIISSSDVKWEDVDLF